MKAIKRSMRGEFKYLGNSWRGEKKETEPESIREKVLRFMSLSLEAVSSIFVISLSRVPFFPFPSTGGRCSAGIKFVLSVRVNYAVFPWRASVSGDDLPVRINRGDILISEVSWAASEGPVHL